MKHKKWAVLLMALALTCPLSVFAEKDGVAVPAAAAVSSNKISFTARSALRKTLDEMTEKPDVYQVPGLGVILYKDGREVYSHFSGSRYLDESTGKKLPVTRDTRFRIASVSKQFTVFTLMQLAEKGKLNLKDDVSKYLGFTLRNPAYPEVPITLEMLASHTSSIRNAGGYSALPQETLKEFFRPGGRYWEDGAHFAPYGQAPGEYFCYCDLNYGVLGTVIEAVTGKRFDRYQQKHILKELDTSASYVPANFSRKQREKLGVIYRRLNAQGKIDEKAPWKSTIDDYSHGAPKKETYFFDGKFHSMKGYKPGRNATFFSPQGGLRISCEELGHTLEMLMKDGRFRGRKILSPESVAEILRPHWKYDPTKKNGDTYYGTMLSYGLGEYQVYGNSTGRVCRDYEIDLVGHTGEAYGLLSGIFFRPGTKDGFVYVINGLPLELDEDPRTAGQFSGCYLWEERIMDSICKALWGQTENN